MTSRRRTSRLPASAWPRNEVEPLQLAIRSDRAMRGVRVQVDAPRNAAGATLNDLEIGVVGYVPIDYPTNYYSTKTAAWVRKYPASPPACDGWAGYWPDPLLPRDTFDLSAGTTQPVWVTLTDRRGRCPGRLHGRGSLHVRRRRDRPRALHRARLGLRVYRGRTMSRPSTTCAWTAGGTFPARHPRKLAATF